jgi:hypothetical protein
MGACSNLSPVEKCLAFIDCYAASFATGHRWEFTNDQNL